MLRLFKLAAVGVLAGLCATPSWSADLGHRYDGRAWRPARVDISVIPACDDPAVTRSVARQFDGTRATYWNADAQVVRFTNPDQIAYRPWGASFTIRRFCRAEATLAVGGGRWLRRTAAYYEVIDRDGLAGVGWGVRWCLVGYDTGYGYQPNCKMLRP